MIHNHEVASSILALATKKIKQNSCKEFMFDFICEAPPERITQ
jgi:hypothetical protein